MAQARLSALASVLVGVWLAASLPPSQGSGVISLIGWLGVAVLGFGLAVGYRGAVAVAAVAFVLRSAVVAPFDIELSPPSWAQALLIVLMVELAGASFTFRNRPADPLVVLTRASIASVLAAGVVQTLTSVTAGAVVSGVVVRVAGIAAVVIAAGWVTRVWRRSGLSG